MIRYIHTLQDDLTLLDLIHRPTVVVSWSQTLTLLVNEGLAPRDYRCGGGGLGDVTINSECFSNFTHYPKYVILNWGLKRRRERDRYDPSRT